MNPGVWFIIRKRIWVLGLGLAFSAGCGVTRSELPAPETPKSLSYPKAPAGREVPKPIQLPPLMELKPKVAAEEALPYEGRLFTLTVRAAPLQDVLAGLAREADLNLVMNRDVDPDLPVSAELRNVPLRNALKYILESSGYFYKIEGNVIKVQAYETRFYRLNYPLVSNKGEAEIGGDVLGSAGSEETKTDLKGDFTVEAKISDEKMLDVWEQVEQALKPRGKGGRDIKGLLSENGRALLDRMSGTIVVTDKPEVLSVVEKFIQEVDRSLRRQVLIEAKIMAVQLNNEHRFGIDWTFFNKNDAWRFSTSSALSTGTTVFNLGVINPGNFSFFLDALSTQGNINVLASPRLSVINNQSALITVGTTIAFVDFTLQQTLAPDTNVLVNQVVPTIQRAQLGVTLGITPQIGDDGITTMHIVPIVTDQNGETNFAFQGVDFSVPNIDIRQASTFVRVMDGETIVLGGLIQDRAEDTVTKVPFIGDIPMLGKLFQQQVRTNKKTELVILLTPQVVER